MKLRSCEWMPISAMNINVWWNFFKNLINFGISSNKKFNNTNLIAANRMWIMISCLQIYTKKILKIFNAQIKHQHHIIVSTHSFNMPTKIFLLNHLGSSYTFMLLLCFFFCKFALNILTYLLKHNEMIENSWWFIA